jgi:hypothetical protein
MDLILDYDFNPNQWVLVGSLMGSASIKFSQQAR